MFAFLRKLFSRRAAAPAALSPAAARGCYTVAAPAWHRDERRYVYRGSSGDAIAILANEDQAITLQDTLNLANGERPSRRLLDAIYREESVAAASATRPRG